MPERRPRGRVVTLMTRQRIWGGGELFLEQLHAFDRAQLRVVFRDGEKLAQRPTENRFGGGTLRDVCASGYRLCTSLRDSFKRRALVLHITAYRFDQVGYQIMAPLELNVNFCPGVLDAQPQGHE